MTHRRHKGYWSELHPELLTLIAGRLQTRHDFLHFRSVCTNWRYSTHQIPNNLPILSPFLPHKFVRTPRTLHRDYGNPLTIVANTTFLIQNPNSNFPKPWLFTVEELNPGKLILRKPLVRKTIEEDFPRVLDLSRFRVRKIRKDYNFRNVKGDFLPIKYKLLLFSDYGCGDPTSVDDCYALVIDNEKKLSFARLKDAVSDGYLQYSYLKHGSVSCFHDIVCYKGGVWIVDRKGRAYVIRFDTKHVRLKLFAAEGVCSGYTGENRLLESDEGLYLIHRDAHYDGLRFSVYKLNEEEHKWCEVKDLDGRILFVSSYCCFFAPVQDFPGFAGNFIIYYMFDAAPCSYWGLSGAEKDCNIGVFNLDDGKYGLISSYPGFSDIFWPPPCWLFSDTCPSTSPRQKSDEDGPEVCNSVETCSASLAGETNVQATGSPTTNTQEQLPPTWIQLARSSSSLFGGDEENECKIPTLGAPCASNGVEICKQALETKLPAMDVHPIHRDTHASRYQNFNCSGSAPWKTFKRIGHNIEPNLRDEEENEAEISILDVPCAPNGVQIGEQASKTKLPAMDAHRICRDSHAPTVQNFGHDAPRKTLKRYNIEPNLIPTLEKILEKHGDITEGCALRNNDMISTALESLATTVLILKNNTGRSLSERQAKYLGSSLSDLQYMRFKIGWLAPFVEMALAIKIIRPLVDSLEEFSEESKMKIIPLLEEVDLDEGLGEGLY